MKRASTVFALLFSLAPAALAQDGAAASQDPAAAPAPAAQTQRLPEIVVTAQKVKQALEEVPASVSVVDGDFIRKAGTTSFQDMQDYAPNVTIALSHTAGTFAIRGFATPDTNRGFDPSVGAVVDGVYYGRSHFMFAFFHDLDRFEVLRGPQGTLFGKNSTAGVLNVVTNAPENKFKAIAEVQAAGYGDRSIRPVVQMAAGENLSLRMSGNYSRGDRGTLFNTFLNRPENNVTSDTTRLRARFTPSGRLSFDGESFYSRGRINNNGFEFSELTPKMLELVQRYDPRADAKTDKYNSANLPSLEDTAIRGANATVNYDLGGIAGVPDFTLTAVTAYADATTFARDLDADFSPVPFIHDVLAAPSVYQQGSAELRVSGERADLFGWGHRFNFISGVYFARSTFRSSDIFAVENLGGAAAYCNATSNFCGLQIPGLPFPLGGQTGDTLGNVLQAVTTLAGQADQSAVVQLDQHGRSYAFFGQFEHFFLRHWALIGGLRYGEEKKEARATSHSDSQLIKQIASQVDHDTPLHRVERDLSPKAGFKWEPDSSLSAYLTWARGYKSGGFNALPLNDQYLAYEPEQATSIELGVKTLTDFFGGPLRIGAALFSTEFDNLQVSTFLGGNFVVLNAAAARSRGFDLDLHWRPPLQGLSLTVATGLANARYKSYPDAPAIADSGDKTQDLSGRRLTFAPRWTTTIIPAYQLPFLPSLDPTFSVEMMYRGDRYLDVDLDPRKLQPAQALFNARLSLGQPARGWDINLVSHNITNKITADQAISQPLAAGNILRYRTDHGRYYTANLSFAF